MSFFKTALVVCLFLLTLTASPIHNIPEIDFVPTEVSQSLLISESQFETPKADKKLYDSSEISSKLHRSTQDFYIWRARPLELIFPTRLAAVVLQGFNSAILAQLHEQWSLQAPLPSFWIKHGNLELLFESVGGAIRSVVRSFAQKILCATQLGWIGTYDLVYRNHAANRAMGVTLRTANNQLSLPQQQLTKSRTVKSAKRTGLKKRSKVHLIAFKIYGGIVPVSLAAPFAKAFFDAIAVEASNAWAARPESALFTVTQGRFQLTVSCLGARVPWPMLVSAAQEFSALADHFWVNTFDAFYEQTEFSITIALSLRLLQEATGPALMTISPPTRRRNLQSRTLPAKSTTPLRPRSPSPPTSPGIRVTSFIRTAALVPGALAAEKLEDFYTIIALKIETGQLANLPPSKHVVCSLWDFELSFSCDKINVPLSFVQAFAIDMAEWSSRQFTGFYDATVRGEGPLSGLVFYVQMRLKGKGQQSPYFR